MLHTITLVLPAAKQPDRRRAAIVEEDHVRLIEQLVLRAFELDRPSLMTPDRGRAPIAFARQVAIYLTHVQLGLTLTDAGKLFRRDRTTAAHACRIVEDSRERPDVETRLAALERAFDLWLKSEGNGRGLLQ